MIFSDKGLQGLRHTLDHWRPDTIPEADAVRLASELLEHIENMREAPGAR